MQRGVYVLIYRRSSFQHFDVSFKFIYSLSLSPFQNREDRRNDMRQAEAGSSNGARTSSVVPDLLIQVIASKQVKIGAYPN